MDTRRLNCLVLGCGLVAELSVHDRDAQVRALQWELRRHLQNENNPISGDALVLFVARYKNAFLHVDSVDAQRLAFDDAEQLCESARFLVPPNAMEPTATVHDYFPLQPPLVNSTSALIHVLAGVGLIKASQATVSLGPRKAMGRTARLVASAKRTRADPIHRRNGVGIINGTNRSNGSTARLPPLVLRCATRDGLLWLSDDDVSKNMLLVPPAWRELAVEIFRWLFPRGSTWSTHGGRRAVLTGAPRGGKSAFLGFLLVQLLRVDRSRPVCIVDVPGVTFARISEDDDVLEGTRGEDFQEDLDDPQTIYVLDAPAAGPAVQPLHTSATTSLIVVSYLVVPTHANDTETFVLPMWTLEDAQMGRHFAKLPLKGLQSLYEKWGGIPGRLLPPNLAASEARLEMVLTRLTHDQIRRALTTLQCTQQWFDVVTGPDSERWRPLVLPIESETQRFVFDGHVAFTSQHVCDRVVCLLKSPTWCIRRHATLEMPTLWRQIRKSLDYLTGEEEEKNETPPPPTEAAGKRGRRTVWT